MSELSSTAKIACGMVACGNRTGMLKRFFGGFVSERMAANLRVMRVGNERKLTALRALEPEVAADPLGARPALELGTGMSVWLIDVFAGPERRLQSDQARGG